jgi:hypothetical protein
MKLFIGIILLQLNIIFLSVITFFILIFYTDPVILVTYYKIYWTFKYDIFYLD